MRGSPAIARATVFRRLKAASTCAAVKMRDMVADMTTLPRLLIALLIFAASGAAAEGPGGVLGALVAAARSAPEPMHEGSAKTYRTDTLRPEGLKACILLAHGIDRTIADADRLSTGLRDLDDRIAEAGPRLKTLSAAGLTNKAKRAEYEAGLAEYNAWVEKRAEIAGEHNRRVQEYGEMASRFDEGCNGMAFFPTDLADITSDLPAEVRARLR